MSHLVSNEHASTYLVALDTPVTRTVQVTRHSYDDKRQLALYDANTSAMMAFDLTPEQCRELAHDLLIAAAQTRNYAYPR